MSSFNSIKKYVSRNSNTGNECTVNEALHFGLGLYLHCDAARKLGFPISRDVKGAFITILPNQLNFVLAGLKKLDGYLSIDK